MTTIRTRARVGKDGNVTIPVGAADAGTEVEVTVTPAPRPDLINGIPREEWFEILNRTAGSIPDFAVPEEAVIDPIPRLDDE